MRYAVLVCVSLVTCLFQGCAHIPLKNNTLRQARTLSEVFENQVLDNIAQTIAAPNTTPYFSYPNGGSVEIEQGAGTDGGLTWDPSALSEVVLNAAGSGSLREVWSVTPVSNPDRLELMHCLLAHVTCKESDPCLQCNERLAIFFGNRYPECLPQCFFSVGRKRDVPKDCVKVGHHKGVYVWVTQRHYPSLRAITLAMLDIATADLTKFSAADTKTIKIQEKRKTDEGVEITAEYFVSPEDYKSVFPNSDVQYAPQEGFPATQPMLQQPFRSRIDERNSVRDSILSLPSR